MPLNESLWVKFVGCKKLNVDKLINVASSIHRDVIALINLKCVEL